MCIERGRERKEEEEDDDAYFASDEPGTDWRIGVDGSGCECKDAEIKAETDEIETTATFRVARKQQQQQQQQ